MKRPVRIPIVIILLLIQTCTAALSSNCQASSCGNIPNISYPFRLSSDPSHCGDARYQLQCENNTTLLALFSGKYRVQEIDYKRYKIRVSDAEDGTCSSMPRYFLHSGNFSNDLIGPGRDPLKLDPFFQPSIAYFNCSDPIADDPRYVAVEARGCDLRGHVYGVVRDSRNGFGVKDIKVGCQLMVATFGGVGEHKSNGAVSYGEILKMLSQGFELSWLYVICENQCGKGIDCSVVDESTDEVRCGQKECRYIYEQPNSVTYQCSGGSIAENIISAIRLMQIFGLNKATGYDGDIVAAMGTSVGRYIFPYFIIRFIFGVVAFVVLLIYKWGKRHKSKYENIETFLQENTLAPIRYSYKEIQHMTRGFKEKLGQGGFGLVYKGKLRSGSFVAIKILSKSKSNGQDFISEVGTIGRIHHTNVVRLIGFCVESSNHALVYEFMPNGSLDKYIFSKQDVISLTHRQIYEISLGVARGIAYLHEGCDIQILHFDIKPHNILLDENFVPKVSDFGLARLYPTDKSIITLTDVRGTLGYMAPELFYHNLGGVSYKADVYSFGMLLMEMANKKRNFNAHANDSSEFFFPLWIYDQLSEENEIEGESGTKQEYKDEIKKMFLIALWCIQLKSSDRPPMNKVVEMLEGELENIEMPPKPSLFHINDHKNKSYETSSNDDSGWTSYTEESIVHTSSEYST
ncbi:brassinosteroid insensitive 1-associated receptor kinase 1 [Vigna unguiculata]|uniref:Brassinosteroid insensitive 1-associated receptor kinase 1 n=1 Tax=Vigna unguiculata TaxID=3917 RepID=A0A4D6MKH4_VIGUN|nr:brassinosteroid insensitive 1-associated receptor kinase 1 [Vigna unguiculata]